MNIYNGYTRKKKESWSQLKERESEITYQNIRSISPNYKSDMLSKCWQHKLASDRLLMKTKEYVIRNKENI